MGPRIPPSINYRNNHHCNGHNNDNSHLLLCQWTPLSPAATTSSSEDPPKHIIRYTPIPVKSLTVMLSGFGIRSSVTSFEKWRLGFNLLDTLFNVGVKQESVSPAGFKLVPFGFGFMLKKASTVSLTLLAKANRIK
uniref:Uncharacterized protein n=1 Tax=Salix viminalis TaxID=40686 RepID=A0A6N2MA73_SALVM